MIVTQSFYNLSSTHFFHIYIDNLCGLLQNIQKTLTWWLLEKAIIIGQNWSWLVLGGFFLLGELSVSIFRKGFKNWRNFKNNSYFQDF
jgi:hypothetical protein